MHVEVLQGKVVSGKVAYDEMVQGKVVYVRVIYGEVVHGKVRHGKVTHGKVIHGKVKRWLWSAQDESPSSYTYSNDPYSLARAYGIRDDQMDMNERGASHFELQG
ncbi:hypothetical protein M514_25865 [Trichuris suis]|uniref:Uncharacterized protein n=1 Tax=Trichuris suis TaxID=68888 RepID=A0A085MXH6_9BILA|nr:hypothetical protein M514_25865 [Trichuris suis]